MRQKIAQAKASYQWLQAVGNGATALESLQELTRAMARLPSVKLEAFVIDEVEIRLQGRTRTFEIVDRLKQELDRSERFGEITLVDAELDNRDRSVRFSFSIKRR
jgi:hypothetical protein